MHAEHLKYLPSCSSFDGKLENVTGGNYGVPQDVGLDLGSVGDTWSAATASVTSLITANYKHWCEHGIKIPGLVKAVAE